MSLQYVPEHFSNVFQTELGGRIWSFLCEPDTVIRLETATALQRPAVEGIEEQLLELFAAQVLEDRVKQMIGHMTRQVMESRGFVVDQQDVRLTNGAPFSRATRYVRRDELTYYAFRDSGNPRSLLLSLSKQPAMPDSGEWRLWKAFKGELRACVGLGLPHIRHFCHFRQFGPGR